MNFTVSLKLTVIFVPLNRSSHIPAAKSPPGTKFCLWTFGKFVHPFEFQCVDCSLNEGNGSYLESHILYRIMTDNSFYDLPYTTIADSVAILLVFCVCEPFTPMFL